MQMRESVIVMRVFLAAVTGYDTENQGLYLFVPAKMMR